MTNDEILNWLLDGDVSIQFQVYRDLLSVRREDLQKRIESEGWGKRFLSMQKEDGHWGQKYYQPKWISTHYTLLDLRNLGIRENIPSISAIIDRIAQENKGPDGGILPIGASQTSDVCVNGMFLNFACYFGINETFLHSVIDFILSQHMADGGFNCQLNRAGAVHSSLHSTISVLEGLTMYSKKGYQYRSGVVDEVVTEAIEFILVHRLFLSDRTGDIIHPSFLKMPYPSRWKYDILRAMDYFRFAENPWDDRMKPAIDVILNKRRSDGRWNLQAKYPGKVHFEMEKAGKPSQWNTLRALRVLKYFNEMHNICI